MSLAARVAAVIEALDDGRDWSPSGDPIGELVGTILSQNTRDSDRVYAALRAALPTWESVRDAPEPLLAEILRPGGLARVKAHRLSLALNAITDRVGRLDLGHLAALPPADAFAWLAAVPGVGPKTAACVLLFGFGRPVLPVDDHVHRCLTRLGLAPRGLTPRQSHARMQEAVGDDVRSVYLLHTRLHRLSRQVCQPHVPHCDRCPLAALCVFNVGEGVGEDEGFRP